MEIIFTNTISVKTKSVRSFCSEVKSNIQDNLRQTNDCDFWMKENFFDKFSSSVEESIRSIDKILNRKRTRGLSNSENYKRRYLCQ